MMINDINKKNQLNRDKFCLFVFFTVLLQHDSRPFLMTDYLMTKCGFLNLHPVHPVHPIDLSLIHI